ncbi:EamA family transporter [Aquabacter spiritensis]|uniref:O-acetylserine/cysteine efflux transporter n=1 Tax=Aquabacter spiritensis TaxID=933073 RepID=A0A4R3LZ49_9HYPH|nr:EamA family transporter [Aquabacter spiritensis]TCT06014.1 O-acetylserine/cysteine efflux transporter [Aquabacter spiritensis]
MAPRHLALAVLAAAIWGVNFVVMRFGLDHYPPLLLTTLRFVAAALPVFFVPRPALPAGQMVAIGLTWFLGQFAFLFSAIDAGMPPGLASLALQAQAFFTILIAALFLGERPRPRQLAGAGVALAGLLLIAASTGGDMTALGLALTLCGAASWATGNVLIRRAPPTEIFALVAWLSLVPPLPAFALSLALEGWPAVSGALLRPTWEGLGAVAFLAIGATWIGYGIWGHLLKLYPAGTVAPFSLLVPLAGTVTAALVLGERFPPLRLGGMGLIAVGLLLVALPPLRGGRSAK